MIAEAVVASASAPSSRFWTCCRPPRPPIPGLQVIVTTPAPLPGGGKFPVEFVIRSTGRHDEMLEFAQKLRSTQHAPTTQGAPTFYFADIDLKFDQPQAEIVIDRDKVAALGLNLSRSARDLGAALGGNYVNRFDIAGRSYKVIPQVERAERLNPAQLAQLLRHAARDGQLIPLSHHRHAEAARCSRARSTASSSSTPSRSPASATARSTRR